MECRVQINAPGGTGKGSEGICNHFPGFTFSMSVSWQELTWEDGLDKKGWPSRKVRYIIIAKQ